ncbi:METTL5 family protein [Natrialbaceae archaeon GCM10025810]|uniref:METTL5 family protein n=1 Tax=Halovalidus salilacus TaxID=3075124 RepID=UPI00360E04D0
MPSRRTIARRLETLEDFPDPSPDLEQYLTPPELAAHICHFAAMRGDLADGPVVDLGTGTGMLAAGAALAGANRVVGIDVDPEALEMARANAARVYATDAVEVVRGDVSRPPIGPRDASGDRVPEDGPSLTVLSNPPFGAQRGNRHADRTFLETAQAVADVSYTIHNEGSREFVESFAADAGATVTHAFAAPFPIDRRFDFHADDRRTLEAEVYRIEWGGKPTETGSTSKR